MSKVLVFAEVKDSKIKKSALELISAARSSGADVFVAALGAGSKAIAAEAGSYGVKKVFGSEAANFSNYNPEVFTAAMSDLIKSEAPDIVLASGSSLARDLFPRVAARTGSGYAADGVGLAISGKD